jgi:hypothetical protein
MLWSSRSTNVFFMMRAQMTINLLGDLGIAALLILTTIWCMVLSRRLRQLRVDRGDVDAFVSAVEAAVMRAETAISGIRETAKEAQTTLLQQRELIDVRAAELVRLAEGGSQMARRLELVLQRAARHLAEAPLRRERDPGPPARASQSPLAACQGQAENEARTSATSKPRVDGDLLRALEALR